MKISPLRLWIRTARARRMMKRAQLRLRHVEQECSQRIRDLEVKYNYLLDYERARVFRIESEWASRFMQLHKLNPMMTADLESDIPTYQPESATDTPTLPYDAEMLLLDRRAQFWQDGEEAGQSEADIYNRWKEMEPRVLEEVSQAISFS